ncbi:hypothetical protein Vadar_012856 [Vaccinium darrowii]|uniref:Uncharacterized protein n=1 Tax=Vaccinium darrowii TaxID=229202 RepID=A0ACB7X9E2_9ERIC|nr:hypothetical protein Vadar_012856 [Vaccinium darrowii]
MGKQRAVQKTLVKTTRKSTTEKVGGVIEKSGKCGKIRQARVSEKITCVGEKKKRQPPSEVPKEESSIGENSMPVVKAVYVKNLPKNITQDRLKELFEHHGKITKVVLPSAKVGHEKSRFGFVHFKERSSAMKALKNTEKYEIDGQVLECSLAKPPADQKSQQPALFPTYPPADQKSQQPALFPTYPPADQKSQQPALLPTYPPPWLGYGLVGGAYGALGAGYGGAGFGQPMMYDPSPIIYASTSTPGMTLVPIRLPDGRIGHVLQQPGAQGPAPPPPQQSSSTGGSSSGGSSSSDSGRGGSCYNPY